MFMQYSRLGRKGGLYCVMIVTLSMITTPAALKTNYSPDFPKPKHIQREGRGDCNKLRGKERIVIINE